jgi:hypothetical protein
MRENEPDSLPFDSPEQENVRLKDQNRRLRRLLEVHGIAIPQLAAPEKAPVRLSLWRTPSIAKNALGSASLSSAVSFASRGCLRSAMGEGRELGLFAGGCEGLESHSSQPSGRSKTD